jgi:hypothetical protein
MKFLLAIFALFLVANAVFLACSFGVGFLLSWAFSEIEFGTAVLIASVSNLAVVLGAIRMLAILPLGLAMTSDDDDDDDDDDHEYPSRRELPPLRPNPRSRPRKRYRPRD